MKISIVTIYYFVDSRNRTKKKKLSLLEQHITLTNEKAMAITHVRLQK